jgi:flagellar motility protein MotE (MotC chaperone)
VSLQVVALVVPIVVAVVSGAFAYVQARKIADRNASLETRKIDLSEYESLNRALRDEIDKLRTDRVEDANRHREEIARISSEIRDLEERARSEHRRLAELEQKMGRLVSWSQRVLSILRQPDVAGLLAAGAVTIPPPPPDLDHR